MKSFLSFFLKKKRLKILFFNGFWCRKNWEANKILIFFEKKTSQTNDDGKICDEKCTLVMHILCSSKATLILSAINYRKRLLPHKWGIFFVGKRRKKTWICEDTRKHTKISTRDEYGGRCRWLKLIKMWFCV